MSWKLTAKYNEEGVLYGFATDESCPYYRIGHTLAKLKVEGQYVTGIFGPAGELFEMVEDFSISPSG